MDRILITEAIRSREDFYGALGRLRSNAAGAPHNLDDLADFLREQRTAIIVASDMDIDGEGLDAIATVLEDQGVKLVR